eukprot:3583594-Rhodomonas_salina.1
MISERDHPQQTSHRGRIKTGRDEVSQEGREFTSRNSRENWRMDMSEVSVPTTWLATFLCTNSSPGPRPTSSLAGTRASEHPTHRNLGAWPPA